MHNNSLEIFFENIGSGILNVTNGNLLTKSELFAITYVNLLPTA